MDIKTEEKMDGSKSKEVMELTLYLKAAHEVLDILRESFPSGLLPFENKTRKVICGSEIKEENYDYLHSFFYWSIDGWLGKYESKNGVKEYLTYMFRNGVIDKPKFSDNSGKDLNLSVDETVKSYTFSSDEIIVFPIVDIIHRKKTFNLSDDEILCSYKEYMGRRKSSLIERVYNTPILGFESDVDYFSFSDEFSIEILSDRHKNLFSDFTSFINGYSMQELVDTTHMIRWVRQIPRGETLSFDHEKYLYLLVMSIRLSASSDVVAKFSYNEPKDYLSRIVGGGKWHFETSKPSQFYETHVFSMNDLVRAKAVYSDLLRLENVKGYKNIFNVVLRRYLSSLSRTSPEDAVIDFTICLESLLLANEREELKFRLSLRGAIILQDFNPADSKKILANMYDDRSAIVHNGKTLHELRGADGKKYVRRYREITEKIILAYIEKFSEFDSIVKVNESLDALCLNAGKKS